MRPIRILLQLLLKHYRGYANDKQEYGLCGASIHLREQHLITEDELKSMLFFFTRHRPVDNRFGMMSDYLKQFKDMDELALVQADFSCTDLHYWIGYVEPRIEYLNYHIKELS